MPILVAYLVFALASAAWSTQAAAATSGGGSPQVTVLCYGTKIDNSTVKGTGKAYDADNAGLVRAFNDLCAGKYAAASAEARKIRATFEGVRRFDGTYGIDFDRVYFAALLGSGDADGARRFLDRIEKTYDVALRPSERDFFAGEYADSFAAYAAQDREIGRGPDDPYVRDGKLDRVVADVRSGDTSGAIEVMNGDKDDSLRTLMLGDLYEIRRDWVNAFRSWRDAANGGAEFAQMESYAFDRWNVIGLEMMYYYRGHLPRGPVDPAPKPAAY